MGKKILFVSHEQSKCGVFEFGKNIYDVLRRSDKYDFIWIACSSLPQLQDAIKQHSPAAILYNYHPSVMPWLCTRIAPQLFENHVASVSIPQIGIAHEMDQQQADKATNYRNKYVFQGRKKLHCSLFDYYIAPDPTLLLNNPVVFKTGRLIMRYKNEQQLPGIPVIGSFGFATPNKGFDQVVKLVQEEFDEAIIRLNLPSADFGDANGQNALHVAQTCKELIYKKGIQLQVTHHYWSNGEMLDFLASNTMNIFLYQDMKSRGISSTIDNALAAQRPVAVSDSTMFRHLQHVEPSVMVSKNSLQNIIHNGFEPLRKMYEEWSPENLLWQYETILDNVFKKEKVEKPAIKSIGDFVKVRLTIPLRKHTWLANVEYVKADTLHVVNEKYDPVQLKEGDGFNRILDDKARLLYEPAVKFLVKMVPQTMSVKIPRANVQQGFVFDTVYRFLEQLEAPKLLCVGSYEDTASMSLIKLGYSVEEVDPLLNYTLQDFCRKPGTRKEFYDVIFSTSVIEHDPADEEFVTCISDLLKPGGVAVITCDYNDQWKPGDKKPEVDHRLYTQFDLKERLLKAMHHCTLVDAPDWNCPKPDFRISDERYEYVYTFATFVVKKNNITI